MIFNKKNSKVLSIVIWVIAYISLGVFLFNNLNLLIDSDCSSEMILGNILSKEGGILTVDWYYSTELRVVYVQLIYSLLFRVIKNWHVIRFLSTVLMIGIFQFSYYCFLKSLKLEDYFFLSSTFLIIPFSSYYNYIMLEGGSYLPHAIMLFLLYYFFENDDGRNVKKIIIGSIVAVFAGLNGPRILMMFFIPMLGSIVIMDLYGQFVLKEKVEKDKNLKFLIFLSFYLLGYLVNSKVLSGVYSFDTHSSISIDLNLHNIYRYIEGLAYFIGFDSKAGLSVKICSILLIAIAILSVSFILFNIKKTEKQVIRLLCFFVLSNLSMLTLFTFTDMFFSIRYLTFAVIFLFPIITYFFAETSKRCSLWMMLYLLLFVILSVDSTWAIKKNIDEIANSERIEIVNLLVEKGYKEGFASFWDANITTELSNGEIEVWCYGDQSPATAGKAERTDIYEWLQKTDHKTRKPQGKCFSIVKLSDNENSNFIDDDAETIYSSNNYVVYVYDSYEDYLKD